MMAPRFGPRPAGTKKFRAVVAMLSNRNSEPADSAAFARAAILIVALCFALRMVDVFLVRSDEWFGEQVVTKVLGLAIVIAYAIWSGRGFEQVGFRKTSIASVIWIGFGLTAAVMAATFLAQFRFLKAQAADPIFSMQVQGFTLAQQAVGETGLLSSTGLWRSIWSSRRCRKVCFGASCSAVWSEYCPECRAMGCSPCCLGTNASFGRFAGSMTAK